MPGIYEAHIGYVPGTYRVLSGVYLVVLVLVMYVPVIYGARTRHVPRTCPLLTVYSTVLYMYYDGTYTVLTNYGMYFLFVGCVPCTF